MGFGSRYIPVRHAARLGRLLVTLAMLPAMVLSPLSAEAILIHDHHGHDFHLLTVTLNDSKDYLGSWHCEHEADRQAAELPKEDCNTIVIVFDLPDALMRVRGLLTGTVAVTGLASTPRAVAAIVGGDTGDPSLYTRPWTLAPNPRAGRIVASILLSNHALLL